MVCMRGLLALPLVLLAALPAWAAGTSARVAVMDTTPLVVRGSAFQAGEHVAVRVSGAKRVWRKAVVAGPTGVFVARFATSAPPCDALTIAAVGDRGSRVVRKSPPPMCGADPAPLGP